MIGRARRSEIALWAVAIATGCGVDVGEGPDLGGTGAPPTTADSGTAAPGDDDGDDDAVADSSGAPPQGSSDEGTSSSGASGDPPGDTSAESTGSAATDDGSSSGSEGGSESTDTGVMSDGDLDDDDLPDDDDPFPNDPNLPGTVAGGVVYAQTADRLFTMDVVDYTVTEIGMFSFPAGAPGAVTDIAIDNLGVLYAITFTDLHACNPATAECYVLAALPSESNGLTFVPPGTIDPVDDTLIGIAIAGDWRQL